MKVWLRKTCFCGKDHYNEMFCSPEHEAEFKMIRKCLPEVKTLLAKGQSIGLTSDGFLELINNCSYEELLKVKALIKNLTKLHKQMLDNDSSELLDKETIIKFINIRFHQEAVRLGIHGENKKEVIEEDEVVKKKSSNRVPIPKKLKEQVYEKYKNSCSHCSGKENLEIHHIIPYSVCKKHEIDNLLLLCFDCHHEEHLSNNNLGEGFESRIDNLFKIRRHTIVNKG